MASGSASVWGAGMKTLQTVDLHCEGEPARVVIGGLPAIPGSTMVEKRSYCMEHLDHLRKLLLLEPRGYPCQNADFIVPPCSPEAVWGVVIAEQGKVYAPMSGHNIMCVATALLETGLVPMVEPVTEFALDTPAGLVNIRTASSGGRCRAVTLRNCAAWVEKRDLVVEVPGGVGKVTFDIVYSGMWFAVVDAPSVGLELKPECGKQICRLGEMIKVAAREQHPVQHPEYDYAGPEILVFTAPGGGGAHGKNAVVMSNGQLLWDKPETWTGMLDRSPCGTGTCAVMALRWARGLLKVGEPFVHESIIGTRFTGRLVEEVEACGRSAVVPEITGSAWITQHCQVVVQPDDPFPEGYTVADIWAA
eukprot:NODE_383_length_1614_cov_103.636305.p1 GENE.NODE_383_length_1614_cov_103.636305~~NODE_383_length_1614_cov_103.636305.p1  ORF type:complete len:362 (+),score=92.63 NODE_383_length_1614_cov_103.636305:136-1221(+)